MSRCSGHGNNVSCQYHVHSDNVCAGVLGTVTMHHASIVYTTTTHMLGSWAQALLITRRPPAWFLTQVCGRRGLEPLPDQVLHMGLPCTSPRPV